MAEESNSTPPALVNLVLPPILIVAVQVPCEIYLLDRLILRTPLILLNVAENPITGSLVPPLPDPPPPGFGVPVGTGPGVPVGVGVGVPAVSVAKQSPPPDAR